ncbi:NAD(P)-binding protein [Chloroflexota bacterium]
MTNKMILGPDKFLSISYKELPIGSSAIGFTPDLIPTGAWRFFKPVVRQVIPPCNEACPAGVDVRGFISLVNDGDIEKAAEFYLDENPFPAICGRVCFHYCEGSCNRADYDEAVAVNGLENYIGNYAVDAPSCLVDNGKRVAVVGSGPAGLSCAYYLKRLGYSVEVFEREPEAGGVLRYYIPEYRLPGKVLNIEIKRLTSMGINIRTGKELGQNLSFEELNSFDAVFIATGAHIPGSLDIPGIEADGVCTGLDFLKNVATGNIRNFNNKVAVIGGGNTAIDVARTVLRLGGNATIYYRRTLEEIPAIRSEITDCLREGINIQFLSTPLKVMSEENKVTGIEFIRNKLDKQDESGRPAPQPVEGTNFKAIADTVILAVGEGTDLSVLSDNLQTKQQLVKINDYGQSSDRKIFAGGDVTHNQRTVVDAIGSGKRAAIGIDCYLDGKSEKETRTRLGAVTTGSRGALSFSRYIRKEFSGVETASQTINYKDLNTAYFRHEKRNERQELPPEKRTGNFGEARRGFTQKVAQKEASRCFSCGTCNACGVCHVFCSDGSVDFAEDGLQIEINYNYCKGCGVCEEECPRGAICMVQEE